MAVSNASHDGFLVAVVDFVRVCISHILAGDFTGGDNAISASIASNESVNNAVGDLLGIVGFDRVFRKLACGIYSMLIGRFCKWSSFSLPDISQKSKYSPLASRLTATISAVCSW